MKLGPVKLKISSLVRSVAFYEDVIGLKLLRREGSTAELAAAGAEGPLLILEEVENAVSVPRRSASGLYHFAILLPTRADLGLVTRHLLDRQVYFGHGDHKVSEALYLNDPDENGIEIYADRPREAWERHADGTAVMTTEAVDLEDVLQEAEGLVWSGLPEGTRIGHLHFHVGNLAEAKRFYCDVLGLDIAGSYPDMRVLFVAAGGYHHHLGLNVWAGEGAKPPADHAVGIKNFTILLPDSREIEALIERLNEASYAPKKQEDAWVVRDPWNIEIRIKQGKG
ncbi:glyoxalase [Paenibacillus sp. CAA11]|uniref:VOC family protein n=1 Tax=Paenibacillus sp. CAA11 TaxID=1532905 RepID=UPI000D33D96D|nr:VOC family protein [Paenibacillus sp. CAA11]AWB47048.1 glyoxalase [Paenibacillus sp. CAA11]